MPVEMMRQEAAELKLVRIDCEDWGSRPVQLNEILCFMQEIQPQIPRSMELLRWQYFQSPRGPGIIYTIRERDELVALYCTIPTSWQLRGSPVSGRLMLDAMVHPSQRGRGHFHRLIEACWNDSADACEICFAFPNDSSINGVLRSGFEVVHVPARTKRELKEQQFSIDCKSIGIPFDPTVAKIWSESGLTSGLCRDLPYLNWRYRKPGQQYFCYLIDGDKGFLILKLFANGCQTVLNICELFVSAAHHSTVCEVLAFCESFAVLHGATTMTAYLSAQHPYSSAYDAQGLEIDRNITRSFVAKSPEKWRNLLSAGVWHSSQGDNDVF